MPTPHHHHSKARQHRPTRTPPASIPTRTSPARPTHTRQPAGTAATMRWSPVLLLLGLVALLPLVLSRETPGGAAGSPVSLDGRRRVACRGGNATHCNLACRNAIDRSSPSLHHHRHYPQAPPSTCPRPRPCSRCALRASRCCALHAVSAAALGGAGGGVRGRV